jgi:hypothetical protein
MSIIHKSGTFAFGDRIGGGSDRPLKSVAYDCGFGTADRMRVVFSERLGVTPRPLSRKLSKIRISQQRPINPANIATSSVLMPPPARPCSQAGCIGSLLMRRPVAAKMAFVTAGATAAVAASPKPPGSAVLATIWVSIGGVSSMRSGG